MAGWNLTGNAVSAEFDGSDEQERKELSVSQAVEIAAGALDAIPQLSVLGEVTGFRGPNARSGHCYFQIKDDSAAVDCIIWKGAYLKRTFDLRDGMQVSFKGSFNLYKATGRMSFVARSFSLAGEGLLRQQVAQLAEKLRREGLMDEARKRRIPVFWLPRGGRHLAFGCRNRRRQAHIASSQPARRARLRGCQGTRRGCADRAH